MDRDDVPTLRKYSSLHVDGSERGVKYNVDIELEDLEILQALGSGAFGRVKLVRHPPTDKTYALKCLVKSHIVANNLIEHVVRIILQENVPKRLY